ncbi:hypothetical protein ABBQ32_012485 [Trebouxia sp. C0010 RCD-2024]
MSEVALLAAQAPRRTPTQCGAFEATVELLVAGVEADNAEAAGSCKLSCRA